MPKGLIPLVLSSPDSANFGSRIINGNTKSNRNSISPPISPRHKRHASDAPLIKLSRPPIRAKAAMRRQSQQIPVSLPSLPFTSAEWKKAITEIKRFHVTRRHRACSARCNEILTNIKVSSVVEPAYLIYLNFYAATSLEMCARPLAPASSYRISLLQQARSHYERALSLIEAAEDAAVTRSRSYSAASTLPSLHSPSGSVSSRARTPDTDITTPTGSLSRKSSLQQTETRCRSKKKVSFELPRDRSRWSCTLSEPIIRPDSPTLGFDDEYFTAGAMRQELPEIPAKRSSQQDLEAPTPLPPSMPSISEGDELSPTRSSATDDSGEGYPFFQSDNAEFDSVRSLARYCATLSSLRTQISSHMAVLDELLKNDMHLQQQAPEFIESPILHDGASPMTALMNRMSLQSQNTTRHRSGSSISFPRSGSSMSFASNSSVTSGGDEDRNKDRQARIDKLRMTGWKRKRFDATRYEVLREVVMSELHQQ